MMRPQTSTTGRNRVLAAGLACAFLASPVFAQPWPADIDATVDHGRIGVHVQPMTSELREHFRAPADKGLLVSRVDRDRPGAAAGIEVGDILLEGNGQPLVRPFDLMRIVTGVPQGQELEIGALRDGKTLTFRVRPEGEGMPWLDPEYWRDWLQKGMRMGSEELQKQLRDLEQRLQELQRRLEKLEETSEAGRGEPA